MSHIFIAYSRTDGEFAENVRHRIKAFGLEVWADVESIAPGGEWRKELDEAIRSASALIVIMSPDAQQSEYVIYEWAFAIGAHVPVIPLLLRNAKLHPRLEALQYLDFSRHVRPWESLLMRVRALSATSAVAAPATLNPNDQIVGQRSVREQEASRPTNYMELNNSATPSVGGVQVATIPTPFLVAWVVATIIHPVLVETEAAVAGDLLSKVGFKIGNARAPEVLNVAKQGVHQLAEWLLDRMRTEPDVNEAAARTIAMNLDSAASSTLQERNVPSEQLRDGMRSLGGATAAIAETLRESVNGSRDATAARSEMLTVVGQWASQTVEARRRSLIEDVDQNIGNASRARQTVSADQSTIRGVKQRVT